MQEETNSTPDCTDEMLIELGELKGPPPPETDLKIVMTQHVQQQIEEFAASDILQEQAGVLLGRLEELPSGSQLTITAMIKAKKTVQDQSSLILTHECWSQIYREKDILYSDLSVVGWFVTRPACGIALKEDDLFVHRHFFNLPGQVAYVVDPVNHQKGFYAWNGQQVEPVERQTENTGHLARANASSVKTDRKKYNQRPDLSKSSEGAGSQDAGHRRPPGWIIAALVLSLLLLVLTNLHRLSPPAPAVVEESSLQDTQLQEAAEQAALAAEQIEALTQELHRQQDQIAALQADLQQTEALISHLSGDRLFVYTVVPGDSLTAISNRFYNNPYEYQYLMWLNNLEDPNDLLAGQQLLIFRHVD